MGGVDPEDGLWELAQLWTASTADELHRVLVMYPPIRGGSADTFEPYALLSRHHESEPATSVVTATLLLTDRRWRAGVRQLVHRIAESGFLDDDELDLLAGTFLAAEDAVYWQVPDEWFDHRFEIVLGDADDADDVEGDDVSDEAAETGPAVARRDVVPPLRRWAAARTLTARPESWPALRARADELDARSGAAVMCGVLDAVAALPPAAQDLLIDEGLTWSDHAVRLLALTHLADRQGVVAACRIAENDPNARIRAWATKLEESALSGDGAKTDRHVGEQVVQQQLFVDGAAG